MLGRVLIVDDNASLLETLELDLRTRGFTVSKCRSAEAAFAEIQESEFDVVLSDMRMPGMSGLQLCETLSANRPNLPLILFTGFGSLDTAIAAIRAGAYDFVTKPVEFELLEISLRRAIRHRSLLQKVKSLNLKMERSRKVGELIGDSTTMRYLFDQLGQISGADIPVLLTGESGTGKELVARAIHSLSERRNGPFIAINCAALPAALLESELFGHSKGAFTGAGPARKGLLLQAQGGTLLLDEIGELPLELQPKLLRAPEDRKIRPVGASAELPFNARIIASTNRDLDAEIAARRFREDLYFRLNVIQLELPPLRARDVDILILARHFLEHYAQEHRKAVASISTEVAKRLMEYPWPGNVRELKNVIQRAVVLATHEQIAVQDLPEKLRGAQSSKLVLAGNDGNELLPMREIENRYIAHVLEATGGNKTLAAKTLGFDRKTLYRKLKESRTAAEA